VAGFRGTWTWPISPELIPKEVFLPSLTTDRPLPAIESTSELQQLEVPCHQTGQEETVDSQAAADDGPSMAVEVSTPHTNTDQQSVDERTNGHFYITDITWFHCYTGGI